MILVKFLRLLTKGLRLNKRLASLHLPYPRVQGPAALSLTRKNTVLFLADQKHTWLPEDGARPFLTFLWASPHTEPPSMGSWEGPCSLFSFLPQDVGCVPAAAHRVMGTIHPAPSRKAGLRASLLPCLAKVIKLSGSSEQDMSETNKPFLLRLTTKYRFYFACLPSLAVFPKPFPHWDGSRAEGRGEKIPLSNEQEVKWINSWMNSWINDCSNVFNFPLSHTS